MRADKAPLMLAASVMLTAAPPTLTLNTVLFARMCALLKSALDDSTVSSIDVQVRALQCANSIFHAEGIRSAYVRELGPSVFAKIRPYLVADAAATNSGAVGDSADERNELELPMLDALTDGELAIIQEVIAAIEAVLAFAKGEKGTRSTFHSSQSHKISDLKTENFWAIPPYPCCCYSSLNCI